MGIFDIFGWWFVLTLGFLIREPIKHKLLWDNKKFRGYRIAAEIIYFDTVQLGKGTHDITVLNYTLCGKSKDTLLLKKKGDKIGDTIEIISDGEVSYRVKRDWKDIFNSRMCTAFIVCCLSGFIFYANLESINMYLFLGCIILEIINLLLFPISNRSFYRQIKKELGWRIN